MNVLLPSIARVRVARSPGLHLWLPLFLLWPLWAFALLMFFVAAFAVAAVSGVPAWSFASQSTWRLHAVAAALRGAQCEVHDRHHHVSISLF